MIWLSMLSNITGTTLKIRIDYSNPKNTCLVPKQTRLHHLNPIYILIQFQKTQLDPCDPRYTGSEKNGYITAFAKILIRYQNTRLDLCNEKISVQLQITQCITVILNISVQFQKLDWITAISKLPDKYKKYRFATKKKTGLL